MNKEQMLHTNESREDDSLKILIHLMRHGDRAKHGFCDDTEDYPIELTEGGREQAMAKSHSSDIQYAVGVASPRERTRQTAALALAGKEWPMVDFGKKLVNDELLNMPFTKMSKEHVAIQNAYTKGFYMRYLTQMHDNKQANEVTIYDKQARNIAKFLLRYIQGVVLLNALAERHEKRGVTLRRYAATHGGILESFLAEYLDRTEGREARDAFINMFPNGFDYVQGFDVEIIHQRGAQEPEMYIQAHIKGPTGEVFSFNKAVSMKTIRDMAKESQNTN